MSLISYLCHTMLSDFCRTANAIAATTKKSEKERLLADYLVSLDDASLERAAVFFSGSPFPREDQRATGVGGAALSDALVEVTGRTAEEIWARVVEIRAMPATRWRTLFPTDPSRRDSRSRSWRDVRAAGGDAGRDREEERARCAASEARSRKERATS